jgi:hypothetical protein
MIRKKEIRLPVTNGRLSGQEISCSQTSQTFDDLPRLWFFGVSQKVS